ncbi:hypothetical protein F5B21DRAFT_455882 [Xylaria acuta]|nr:hypothetical protein F5B21DRAFT_455882 [Xylaria acuta]
MSVVTISITPNLATHAVVCQMVLLLLCHYIPGRSRCPCIALSCVFVCVCVCVCVCVAVEEECEGNGKNQVSRCEMLG